MRITLLLCVMDLILSVFLASFLERPDDNNQYHYLRSIAYGFFDFFVFYIVVSALLFLIDSF